MSSRPNWRIAVVGLGAVGTALAAALIRAGHDVHLVARGARREALRHDGLLLEEDGVLHRLPAQLADQAHLQACQLVIAAVKAQALPALLPDLAPHIGSARLMPAVNGMPWWYGIDAERAETKAPLQAVDPGGVLLGLLPSSRIIGCVVYSRCSIDAQGIARVQGGHELRLGGVGLDRTKPEDVGAMFVQSGFRVRVEAEIREAVWLKLVQNAATNLPSVLSGRTLEGLIQNSDTHTQVLAIAAEMLTLAERLGYTLPLTPEEVAHRALLAGPHRTSMLQDIAAGRRTELDAIAGAPMELADRLGLAMPYLQDAAARVRLREQQLV